MHKILQQVGFSVIVASFTTQLLAGPFDNVTIRKTFTGTDKDKAAPAAISFTNGSDSSDFYAIDIGIKKSWNLNDEATGKDHSFQPAIAIEYHRQTNELEDEVNQRSASIKMGHQKGLTDSGQNLWINELAYTVTRDSEANTTTRNYQYLTGIYAEEFVMAPGRQFKLANDGATWATYMVTSGFSRLENFKIEAGKGAAKTVVAENLDESFWVTNFSMELYPLAKITQKLNLVAGYRNLKLIGGSDPFLHDNSEKYSISLNYYFDEAENFSFGIDYENGSDEKSNFRELETTTVGFKIKWGE